jgi:hypothetical protein
MRSNKFLTISSFFIYPIGSVLPIFIEMINGKKYSYFFFSLIMGMFGFITIPLISDDLTRYYSTFEYISNLSFSKFIEYISLKPDFLVYWIMYIFSVIGLSKQFIPFLAVFISYYLLLLVFFDFTKYNQLKHKNIFILFLSLFILVVNYKAAVLGIRNSAANSILMYGLYQIYFKNKFKRGILISLFAIMTHIMTSVIVILVLINKFLTNNGKLLPLIFYLSFIFYVVNIEPIMTILIEKISIVGPIYQKFILGYIEGYWAFEFIEDLSSKGRIAMNLGRIPIFLSLIYLLSCRKKSLFRNLVYLVAIFTNFLFSYPNLYGRFAAVLVLVTLLLFLTEYYHINNLQMRRFFLYLYITVFLLKTSLMLYSMRETVIKSYSKTIYQSSFSFFLIDVNESDYITK